MVKPIGSKWVFPIKLCSDSSLDYKKAQSVALGNRKEYGIGYDRTFAHVAKMATIQTILAIIVSQSWPLHQIDAKNSFLHDDLKEEIYMRLPSGPSTSIDVCKLRQSLYGLKKSPQAWFEKFCTTT